VLLARGPAGLAGVDVVARHRAHVLRDSEAAVTTARHTVSTTGAALALTLRVLKTATFSGPQWSSIYCTGTKERLKRLTCNHQTVCLTRIAFEDNKITIVREDFTISNTQFQSCCMHSLGWRWLSAFAVEGIFALTVPVTQRLHKR